MSQTTTSRPGSHPRVGIVLLAGLLFLRLVVDGGTAWLVPDRPEWVDPVYQIGTYALCALLIWWERDQLAEFHIERLALILFLLFKPLQPLFLNALGAGSFPLAFPRPLSFSFLVIAVGLLAALLRAGFHPPKIARVTWIWLAVGALCGVALNFLLALFMAPSAAQPLKPFPVDWSMVWVFPYQVGYAAVSEEPLFRGFLWGYLARAGWKSGWICVFQAFIFMVGHLYRLNYPNAGLALAVTFFGGLVYGLLVWRSRSLASSLAAHGFYNASGVWSLYFLARM